MKKILSTHAEKEGSFIRHCSSFMPGFILLFLVGLIPTAHAQCGPEVKEEVAKELAKALDASAYNKLTIKASLYKQKLAVEATLYEKYKYCAQDYLVGAMSNYQVGSMSNKSVYTNAEQCGAKVSNTGNIAFEEMSCCGYDPQRRQFACPIKIKQRFGFGSAPLPGSREYVFHCVENTDGVFVPVGVDSVHLANELHGNNPSWQFAVIANANNNLSTVYPLDGDTVRARSILSWGFEPTSCDYKPVWGNALDYNIRLDP